MPTLTQNEIDQRIYDLYDEYCHGGIDRREFLQRASVVTIGGLAMAQALLPRYALAQTISFTDQRIKARYVTYPSPGGTSGTMRGYLVQPTGAGPFSTVLVIHENRGLNPYIEDVARRVAVLWRSCRDGGSDEHQSAALDPVRRERRAYQRDVAGLRGGSEGEWRPVRDAHVSRHPAWLSQQLDASLPGGCGQVGLG